MIPRLIKLALASDPMEPVILPSFCTGQMPPEINDIKVHHHSALQWNGNLGNPLLEMLVVGSFHFADDFCRPLAGDANFL